MTIIDTLITNRTGGYYNASDLTRVESAVQYLVEQFNALPSVIEAYLASLGVAPDDIFSVPYSTVSDPVTQTWVIGDVPEQSAFAQYLSNVSMVRDVLTMPSDTPNVPADMDYLTVREANDIERILVAVNGATLALEALKKQYADSAHDAFRYCGTFYSRQGVII